MQHRLPLIDAECILDDRFIAVADGNRLFDTLQQQVCWQQPALRIFGKKVLSPRLSAYYGDSDVVYRYSGITNIPQAWSAPLMQIKQQVEQYCHTQFNNVLLNLYRDGNDSMGWHADNEPELGANPVIASLSLGASRYFLMRHIHKPQLNMRLALEHCALLVMRGATQANWQHSISRTRKPTGARLNLTFRFIDARYIK